MQGQSCRTNRNRETTKSVGGPSPVPEFCKGVSDYIFSHMSVMHIRIGKGNETVLVFGKQPGKLQ